MGCSSFHSSLSCARNHCLSPAPPSGKRALNSCLQPRRKTLAWRGDCYYNSGQCLPLSRSLSEHLFPTACSLLHMWHRPLLHSEEYSKTAPQHQPCFSHRADEGTKVRLVEVERKSRGPPKDQSKCRAERTNPRPSKMPPAPSDAPVVSRHCLETTGDRAGSLHQEGWSRSPEIPSHPNLAQMATGASGKCLPVPKFTSSGDDWHGKWLHWKESY